MSIGDTIVPDFIQRSLLVKVLLGVAVIMLLTGLVGIYFFQGISSDLDSQVDRQVEATAVHHENAYDNWFDNQQDDLTAVITALTGDRTATEYRDLSPETISDELQIKPQQLDTDIDEIRNFHYVDPSSGDIIAGTDEEFIGMNVYDDLGYQESDLTGEQFVLPSQYTASDNAAVLAIGQQIPVTGVDAVLIAEIHAFEAGPQIEQSFENAETGVVSTRDEFIIGERENENQLPQIAQNPELPANLEENITTSETGSAIFAYRQIQGYENFYLVTRTPKSSAFQLRDAVLQNFGLTLGLAFVILIGVMTVGGRSVIKSINTLADRAETMGEGDLDVDLETRRKDEVGVLYTQFDGMRNDLKERIRESEAARDEAESARKEAEVARAEAEEMANYLQEKAEEYSGIMQEVGMGDLTQRMSKDGEEESMDQIADEFNDMIEELEKTTGQLKSYVDEVEEAGAEVEQSADTVREASEQVADSIQKISDDAYNQKERLQNISETMDKVTEDLETLADEHDDVDIADPLDRIREIAADISDVVELSEETMAESQHVAGAAEEQAAELNEVSERANDLQRYAQPLRDILERFQTEAEHEFVFSVGPTGGAESPGSRSQGGDN